MKNNTPHKPHQKLATLCIAAATLLLSSCASTPAPMEQIAVSKAALTSATSAGGNEYAPVQMKSAMDKLDAAQRALTANDYPAAKQLAEESLIDSRLAAATARSAKAEKAANALQEDKRVLQQELDRKTK